MVIASSAICPALFSGFSGTSQKIGGSVKVMKTRIVSKKVIYKGKRIDLIRQEMMIRGRKSVREIIAHPGSAVIIPVLDVKKRTIILIDQYRYGAGKKMIEVPAGTRDGNEASLKCAKREIIEETGYRAARMKKVTSFLPSPGMMTEVMDLFIATGLKKYKADPDFDEQIEIFTTTLDKAVKMIFSGRIDDAKTIAGLLMLKEIYNNKKLYKKYLA